MTDLQAFATDPTPWLTVAHGELGVTEAPDERDNPRVVKYLACIQGRRGAWFLRDSIAWCSAFANWCFAQAGIVGSMDPAARSWTMWGVDCEMRVGAVCILARGLPWQGHVGLVVSWTGNMVQLRSGNHNNAVNDAWYPRSRIVAHGLRWPTQLPAVAPLVA